jgi:hypothetical protein
VTRPEYRVQYTIQAPVGASSWDLFLWVIPGDVNAVMWVAGPSPADFAQPLAGLPTGWTSGLIQLQPVQDLAGTIPYFGNPGNFDLSLRTATANPWMFRHQYKSVTATLVASAVSDQGDVYAAQFPPAYTTTGTLVGSASTNLTTGIVNAAVRYRASIPLDEETLTLVAPEFYMGAARGGIYMPLRLAGPTQPFVRTSVTSMGDSGTSQFPSSVGYYATNGDGLLGGVEPPAMVLAFNADEGVPQRPAVVSYPFTATNGTLSSGDVAFDSGYDNMNQGVIIFRSLAGTGGGGGGFAASVMVKVLAGHEVMPRPFSVDRIYARPAAAFDPTALAAYYAMALELDDAYPASFNALGALLAVLGSIAARLFPLVKAVAGPALAAAGSALASEVVRHFAPRAENVAALQAQAPLVQYKPQAAAMVRPRPRPKRGRAARP